MNWDSIKYIFQIPLDWYRKIHKRVFNAYGTNFLTVREGYYGGTEVGIDSDGFAEEVNRAIDLSDYVKTVNDIKPDQNGNVELSDVTDNNIKVVTGVTWNGTQIAVASQTWSFTNGVLVAKTNNATTYIDTVAFSQS